MNIYGGSFVKLLGALARQADPENLAKIKHTWPEYWAKYQRMGEGLKEKITGVQGQSK